MDGIETPKTLEAIMSYSEERAETFIAAISEIEVPCYIRQPSPERVAELAESIRVVGLLQPIGLRRGDAGRFELVFGGHRLEAHRLLDREVIESCLLDLGGTGAESATLTENLFRTELAAKASEGGCPPLPGPVPVPRFEEAVAATMNVSPRKVRRSTLAARSLSETDLDVMTSCGVQLSDIQRIAAIKDERSRQRAVSLVGHGINSQSAVALATAPENATFEHVEAADSGVKPEAELNDEEWLDYYCQDALARLSYQDSFRKDAIVWRNIRGDLAELRKQSRKALQRPKATRTGPFHWKVASLLNVLHPNDWAKCGPCNGSGKSVNISQCSACHGHGFSVTTGALR